VPELLLLEGEDLPALMARVRDELGPRATIVRAERVRTGGIAGFFSREHFELTVEVSQAPRARPASRPAGDPFEAALDAADRAEAGPIEAVSTAGPRFAAVLEQARALAGTPPAPPPPARPATAPPVPPAASPLPAPSGAPASSTGWSRAAAALVAAGVPASFLDGARGVADVLDRIPPPPRPPRRSGQMLALVGEREAALDVAELLRHRWRLPAQAVVRAGDDGLTSSSAVVRWRIRTAEADHPWLLVVGVSDDHQGRQLAAGLVAAAQPEQVWAVVDARTKPEFAARWVQQVGAARHVDALAVDGLLDCRDPGTVLALGVPVAWADGIPASRVLWAAVLGQGLDEAVARPG